MGAGPSAEQVICQSESLWPIAQTAAQQTEVFSFGGVDKQ